MNRNGTSSETAVAGLARLIQKFQALAKNERLRRYSLAAAAVVFVVGLYLSLRRLPENLNLTEPMSLGWIAAVGVPLAILVNAFDIKLSASVAGTRFRWLQSARISLISTAANMLPLPGGVLVRLAALRSAGAPLLKSSLAAGLIAATWLGLALVFAGAWIIQRHPVVAASFLFAGGACLAVCIFAIHGVCRSPFVVVLVLANKSAMIAVSLLRLKWAFAALGLNIGIPQISVFSVAAGAGSIASFVPAGLGVNETVAAVLAPLTEISPAAAFLAVSLDRIVALPVLLALTTVASMVRGRADTDLQA